MSNKKDTPRTEMHLDQLLERIMEEKEVEETNYVPDPFIDFLAQAIAQQIIDSHA